jgi:membrane protease YdiL (CAAX protease family)
VLVFFAASVAVAGAIAATGADHDPQGLPVIGYGAIVFGCMAAVVVRIAAVRDPESWRSLGLRAGGNARAMAVAVIAYGAALPGILGVISAWPWLLQRVGYEAHEQDVTEIARNLHGAQLIAGGLLIVVAMPLFEELLFRSFLQPLLVQNLGDRGGIVVTSAVFAALHGVSAFLPVFVLALVLGGVMLRTQRLSSVWLMHALHNGLTFAYMVSTHGADSPIH